jgi:hypothetical protein
MLFCVVGSEANIRHWIKLRSEYSSFFHRQMSLCHRSTKIHASYEDEYIAVPHTNLVSGKSKRRHTHILEGIMYMSRTISGTGTAVLEPLYWRIGYRQLSPACTLGIFVPIC